MKKYTWFEVRLKSSSSLVNKFTTEESARKEIEDAKKGYPKHKLHEVDIQYWKKESKDMVVYKITQSEKLLK